MNDIALATFTVLEYDGIFFHVFGNCTSMLRAYASIMYAVHAALVSPHGTTS